MALIQLKNLEKSVAASQGRTWLLRQINLEIQFGDFVTIMGPSGAGKSTLLQILGLLDGDFQGEYLLDGQAVHGLSTTKRQELGRRKVGFVFQHFHLLEDLTVAENLEIPLSYRDLNRAERQAQVADMLDRFQIVGKKDLYPNQLSGGQQQLVGIARALIIEPEILLADEPTGNLHSAQAREVMECFRQLNQHGKTIVQVTHSEENAAYGRRIVKLRDGWLEP